MGGGCEEEEEKGRVVEDNIKEVLKSYKG